MAQASTRTKPANKRYKETGQKSRNKARRIAKEERRQKRLKARAAASPEKKHDPLAWRLKIEKLNPVNRDFDSLRAIGITPAATAHPKYRKDRDGLLRDVSGFTFLERPRKKPEPETPANPSPATTKDTP